MLDIIQHPSPNFGVRKNGANVDMVLLHYTDMTSAAFALDRMCDPEIQVSAHYLIDEAGAIIQMVAEEKRAWHAGVGFWAGVDDINSCSIGIELANQGHSHGLMPFPQEQIESLMALLKDISTRHEIPPRRIIGHSDIAPGRKVDPGPLFPWQDIAESGFGLWPEQSQDHDFKKYFIHKILAKLGYDVTDEMKAISAFQLHYRPNDYTGTPDDETLRLALGLLDIT